VLLKQILFTLLFCAFGTWVFAQSTVNNRIKTIPVSDTVRLDSLSLVPGSVTLLTADGALLDSAYYKINYADAFLFFDKKKLAENNLVLDSIKTSYKTFPYLFSQETKHKDIANIKPDMVGGFSQFTYKVENKTDDIFKTEGLNKSGSISRGITVGTNQDMVVNSNLNLQLSGKLSNDVEILLAATDNNIPIQADGNTQQLQEFDKVFIQLSKNRTKLIAGDFQLMRPQSYFMNFYKKAQGLSFTTAVETNKESKNELKKGLYTTTLSAAVSRGKFARNQIQGIENNQGPYRLRGAENELFIIILSGTEKVYIDGRLLDRGQENDYVINYNTSEITFTAKQLITKDKRIVVEFQYSDKNYARSLVHFGNDYEQKNLKIHFNIYSEQDSKNQPLQQTLTDEQKLVLSKIGDTLSLAVTPSYDSIGFNNSEVLYFKTDTTIGTHTFNPVFIYNTNSDSAHYRVTFSNVGLNKGNYVQISSSANGKVFKWVMPDTVTNTPQGNFEPVIQLITPKMKQMITAGMEYNLKPNSKLTVEAALSNNDINTFSSANNNDNVGYGLKVNFDNDLILAKTKSKDSLTHTTYLVANANYEYVQKYFSQIERFRSIEFERDWNRGNIKQLDDQHIVGVATGFTDKQNKTILYRFNAFFEGSNYNANKHSVQLKYYQKGFRLNYDGSLLSSAATSNTDFYRHKSAVSQKLKWITVGLKDEFEQNKFSLLRKDSLLASSYKFWEWQAYIQNADTSKNRYGVYYKNRTDYAIKNILGETNLNLAATGESYGAYFETYSQKNSQLKINVAYRKLFINDTLITLQKPDNTLVGRIEYNFRLLKGLIFSNTFYEIGSGLELKKEYSFIEVPPGQGIYTWIDYNENGIKELNEFEISAFPDQARYIKVYTPTNEYIKTYSNQFSQSLNIKPAAIWANKKGFRSLVSKLANQTSYRVDRKSNENDLSKAYNPFLAATNDSTLLAVNSLFRNTLFINQMGTVFGLDLTYQDVRNKSQLINGFESRSNIYKEAKLRLNMGQKFSLNFTYKDGLKSSNSQFFTMRNYKIIYYETEPRLNYQPNTSFRTSISFRYADKKNNAEPGGQHAILQDYGVEIKYNVLQKGSLNLKANFIQIQYNDLQNTSLAFEMLDALRVGKNITWGLSYQRNLSNNLQLNLTYDGRQSEGAKAIHTGGVQVRAYF